MYLSFIKYQKHLLIFLILVLSIKLFFEYKPLANQKVFEKIYKENIWGGDGYSGSGYGSLPEHAKVYITALTFLLEKEDIHSIYDLGCGDWQLMSTVNIPGDKKYVGIDVVPNVIKKNQSVYASHHINFKIIKKLQEMKNIHGDLFMIKDVLQHLPNKDVQYVLKDIIPNFKYALITNDITPDSHLNKNIRVGDWRALDLSLYPFNFEENTRHLLDYQCGTHTKRILLYEKS